MCRLTSQARAHEQFRPSAVDLQQPRRAQRLAFHFVQISGKLFLFYVFGGGGSGVPRHLRMMFILANHSSDHDRSEKQEKKEETNKILTKRLIIIKTKDSVLITCEGNLEPV